MSAIDVGERTQQIGRELSAEAARYRPGRRSRIWSPRPRGRAAVPVGGGSCARRWTGRGNAHGYVSDRAGRSRRERRAQLRRTRPKPSSAPDAEARIYAAGRPRRSGCLPVLTIKVSDYAAAHDRSDAALTIYVETVT